MKRLMFLAPVLLALTAATGQDAAPGMASPAPAAAGYHTHAQLTNAIERLAAAHDDAIHVQTIGASREGRDIHALRFALPGDVEPDRRPALLLVAGIDGAHLHGTEVALIAARKLLDRAHAGAETASELLREQTFYLIPRVNPDAAERYFADVKQDWQRNLRPTDSDRDWEADEDGPNDLNGDGLITMMRVYDPAKADLMPDPDEPRLHAVPDPLESERAEFYLISEGVDDDGDGEINEDPIGGVDLNKNFMHGYEEHADGAGPHQVSEPESLALLKYVLDHQNIAAVLVYGAHDNLSETPDAGGRDPAGAPRNLHEEDVALYKRIGERYREITGLEKAPTRDAGGAFFAWAYAQFGVPSFTTPLWTLSEPAEEQGGGGGAGDSAEEEAELLTPSGIGDIAQETLDEMRALAEERGFEVTEEMMAGLTVERVEGFARALGVTIKRVNQAGGKRSASKSADAGWLRYSDEEHGGAGFVDWEPYDHPDLGRVEIGGFVPYFQIMPPAEDLPALAEKQVDFLLDLAGRFPQVNLRGIEVKRLAGGLYEIEAVLVNDGYFPTATAMGERSRRVRPHVVRISTPIEQIVSGQRQHKVWSLPGAGGRETFRWLIEVPDGGEVTITVYSEKYGEFQESVPLDRPGMEGGDA